MEKKEREHPLSRLSDKELDQILKCFGGVFTTQNKENIKSNIQKKRDSREHIQK